MCESIGPMRAATFTVKASGPGRLSTMARPRGGDWLEDEMASLRQAGTDVLVCMLTVPEMRELDLTEEAAVAEAAGLDLAEIWGAASRLAVLLTDLQDLLKARGARVPEAFGRFVTEDLEAFRACTE
jgi:hypothetical protein